MIMVENQPSDADLLCAFIDLGVAFGCQPVPGCMRSPKGWVEQLRAPHVHWQPVLFGVAGSWRTRWHALVWFTDFDAEARWVQVHFAADVRGCNSLAVFRAARSALGTVLSRGGLNVLLAHHAETNAKAGRVAHALGFREWARSGGIVYWALEGH